MARFAIYRSIHGHPTQAYNEPIRWDRDGTCFYDALIQVIGIAGVSQLHFEPDSSVNDQRNRLYQENRHGGWFYQVREW